MISLKLVFRSIKERYYGNQFLLASSTHFCSGDIRQMALAYGKKIVHVGRWMQSASGDS